MTFSDEQPVGEVSATELGKTVGAVLKRVDAGERIVVTRNGHDVALIVSFEAGIEVMLAGSERFAAMRREAREELEAGIARVLEAWRRYRVVIARRAHAELREVPLPDRGRLTMDVVTLSAREPDGGLHAVRSWRYLAACEAFPRKRVVLVYAILKREGLEAELAGRG